MANDEIIFELTKRDGSDVLLDPSFPMNLANTTGGVLTTLLNMARQISGEIAPHEANENELVVDLRLAAADRGCFRLAFRVSIRRRPTPTQPNPTLQDAYNLAGIIGVASSVLVIIGSQLGYLEAKTPLSKPDELSIKVARVAAADPKIQAMIDSLAKTALTSGADVDISFPDQVTYSVVSDPDSAPGLYATESMRATYGDYSDVRFSLSSEVSEVSL